MEMRVVPVDWTDGSQLQEGVQVVRVCSELVPHGCTRIEISEVTDEVWGKA